MRSALFGVPIDPQSDSPLILGKLVAHLSDKVTTPALFRDFTSGGTSAPADSLVAEISASGPSAFFSNPAALSSRDACAVAEVFRRYVFSLPEPLLSFSLYDSFILSDSVAEPADRSLVHRLLISHLSRGFRSATRLVLSLLSAIHANSASSKMEASSLSALFWPVLLRPQEVLFYMRDDESIARRVVAELIVESDGLWKTHVSGHRLASKQKPSDPSAPPPPFSVQQAPTFLAPATALKSPSSPAPVRPRGTRQSVRLSIQRTVHAGGGQTHDAPPGIQRTPSGDFRLALESSAGSFPASEGGTGDSFSELPAFEATTDAVDQHSPPKSQQQ